MNIGMNRGEEDDENKNEIKKKTKKRVDDHRRPMSRLRFRSAMTFFGIGGMVIWLNLPLISE